MTRSFYQAVSDESRPLGPIARFTSRVMKERRRPTGAAHGKMGAIEDMPEPNHDRFAPREAFRLLPRLAWIALVSP